MLSLQDLKLEKYNNESRYKQFLAVLNNFIERKKADPSVTHILVFGSFIGGELSGYSDLDICLTKDGTDTPQEESSTESGVLVNAYICSLEYLRSSLEWEKEAMVRKDTKMLATGRVVYSKNDKLEPLIQLAKAEYEQEKPPLNSSQIQELKAFFDKEEVVFKRYLEEGDAINFHLRINTAIASMVEKYFFILRKPLPQYKHTGQGIQNEEFKKGLLKTLSKSEPQEKFEAFQGLLKSLRKMVTEPDLEQS